MPGFFRIIRIRRRRIRRRRRSASKDYIARKEAARILVMNKLEFFRATYIDADSSLEADFAFKKVAIRNQKSRWGSCSASKNLNFNYRILDLPEELQDYIIVHELCHLKELHHGRSFWSLMEKMIPHARKHHTNVRSMRIA